MDREVLKEVIDQATQCPDISHIGFSGGEPFMVFDLLLYGVTYAKSKGYHVSIATNGFWGDWDDAVVQERFSQLKADYITISTDYYHRAYVPDQTIGRVMDILRNYNIEHSLSIGETKSKRASDYFSEMGDYKYLKQFSVYNFYRAGKARNLPEDEFFLDVSQSDAVCSDEGIIAVRYDGAVYPCCSQLVFDTQLSLGNLREKSLQQIMSSSWCTQLSIILHNPKSFHRLMDMCKNEFHLEMPQVATSGCEFCNIMFREERVWQQLQPRIHQEYERVALDALLNRKAAQDGNS